MMNILIFLDFILLYFYFLILYCLLLCLKFWNLQVILNLATCTTMEGKHLEQVLAHAHIWQPL